MGAPATAFSRAAANIRRWRGDAVAFVREVFGTEPDPWQVDVLAALPRSPRVALKACKGPGKSTVLAWAIWWFLLCHLHPKIVATSITGPNLKDNLWTELAKWQGRSPLLQAAFELNSERIVARDHPKTWWCSARTWPADADATQQANTLAGLHSENVMAVLDEVGDYPEGVVAAAEGIFANATNAHLLMAGNPTRTEGPLYRVCTRDRASWFVVEITGDPDDPKRAPRIDIEWARAEIKKWGRDSPYVMVNVLGQFPKTQSDKLLGPDEVHAATQRDIAPAEYVDEAKILGVDVARFGDDRSVICARQGRVCTRFRVFRELDTMELAGQVAFVIDRWHPDAVFIDEVGIGGGVIDRLRQLGHPVLGVQAAGKAIDPGFADKRCETWWAVREWIRAGGVLPDDPEVVSELTAPSYSYATGRVRLESKDDMRKRGIPSPDKADALALTFAAPVARRPLSAYLPGHAERALAASDFDPFDEARL